MIFPPKCIFCSELLYPGTGINICSSCYKKVRFIDEKGQVIRTAPFSRYLDGIVCACEYSGVIKDSLIRYKFFEKSSYYRTFSGLLFEKLKKMTNYCKFDIIISVPLHKRKQRIRGYNQSLLISRELSRAMGVMDSSGILYRTRDTHAQSLLKREERYKNVKDAFKVNNPDKIKGKKILLVDDILTTGQTISECSRVLKEAGAQTVIAAVIASGRKLF